MGLYHHIYTNNPTAGNTDGTMISENGAMTAPLTVTLDAAKSESKIIKLAIRCEEGYETIGDTTISIYHDNGNGTYTPTGGNVEKWKLAADLSQAGMLTATIATNAAAGDKIVIGDVTLTAGTDFDIGSTVNETATNMAAAITLKSTLYKATASDAAITVVEKCAGAGHTPTLGAITGNGTGSATLSVTTTSKKESQAATESQMQSAGVWGSSVTINDTISNGNIVFWAKVAASSDEAPQKDSSTVLYSTATIQAV